MAHSSEIHTQFLTGVVTIVGTLTLCSMCRFLWALVVALASRSQLLFASAITKYIIFFGKQQGYQGQLGGYAER